MWSPNEYHVENDDSKWKSFFFFSWCFYARRTRQGPGCFSRNEGGYRPHIEATPALLFAFGGNILTQACMYKYIHAFIHTCIHTYIHTYRHTYTHAYTHAYISTSIHTYKHTCMHMFFFLIFSILRLQSLIWLFIFWLELSCIGVSNCLMLGLFTDEKLRFRPESCRHPHARQGSLFAAVLLLS